MSSLSNSDKRTIRFGVMCNGTSFPEWQARCLRKLLAMKNVEPALLIIDDRAPRRGRSLKNLRKLRNLHRLLWYVYSLLERNMSRAMRHISLDESLSQVSTLRCKVRRKGKYSQYFLEDDIEEIRSHDLDFIIRFGFNIIRGEILQVPRFGVWSFHHDDEEKYRGSPPGFWEIYHGEDVAGAILQRLTDQLDAGVVLKKGHFKTIKTSYTRSRDRAFLDSADWPAQVCEDILNDNYEYLLAAPSETTAPIFRAPNNRQMVIFLLKLLQNSVVEISKKLFVADSWNVGFAKEPITAFVKEGVRPSVRWLPAPPRNRFFADPFAVIRAEVLHILVEDYGFYSSKGRISSIRIDGDRVSEPRVALNEPYHLSHPYVIERDGSTYCIPETCDANEVMLYRAVDFPSSWEKVDTLISGFAGVDNTVIEYDGRWWLFATDQNDGPNHKLKIWFAPDLTGPWEPHPLNPVKIDVRSSRPAGTPFIHGGDLYRPAQDCSEAYGKRITLNRVTNLSPTEFREEQAGVIEPFEDGPYSDGTHTVSGASGMTVIDGMKKVYVVTHPSMIVHKLRRIFTSSGH